MENTTAVAPVKEKDLASVDLHDLMAKWVACEENRKDLEVYMRKAREEMADLRKEKLAIEDAIASKPENHSFADDFEVNRPMTAIGG
jgi:hypothetical protein